MIDFNAIPLSRDPTAPEVGTFGRRVTLRVGAGFTYLSPDEADALAEKLAEHAGQARGAQLGGGEAGRAGPPVEVAP